MEKRPPEAPCREEGEAGVIDGLTGSKNVTEVGSVGDCRAGKEIRRDLGEPTSLGS